MIRKLLFLVLSLGILTSMSTGTLAVYTKTALEAEQVQAKRFSFTAEGEIAGGGAQISLAPTESMEYVFTIANVDDASGLVSEVPLQYDVTINCQNAFSAMPGLTAELYYGDQKVGDYYDGYIKYTTNSAANLLFINSYTVVLTWVDDGNNDSAHTAAGSNHEVLNQGLTLTVVATQALANAGG